MSTLAMRDRKLTPLERALPLLSDLADEQTHCFAIQSCNSVSPNHPQWSDLYWWAYGDCLAPFKNDVARIGRTDSSPKFRDLATASRAFAAIQLAHSGRLRSRIVSRVITKHEAFIMGED